MRRRAWRRDSNEGNHRLPGLGEATSGHLAGARPGKRWASQRSGGHHRADPSPPSPRCHGGQALCTPGTAPTCGGTDCPGFGRTTKPNRATKSSAGHQASPNPTTGWRGPPPEHVGTAGGETLGFGGLLLRNEIFKGLRRLIKSSSFPETSATHFSFAKIAWFCFFKMKINALFFPNTRNLHFGLN